MHVCIDFENTFYYNDNMKRLSDLVEIRSGYTFRSSIDSFALGDIEVIQAKDLGAYFDHTTRSKIDFPGGDKHLLKPGDILVSARGFSKAILFSGGHNKAVASSSLFVLRPKTSRVSPEFITMFFNSTSGIKAVHGLSAGGALRSITKENLGQIVIPEIPPDKSQALGKAIQAIDDYQSLVRKKEIYLDNLRKSIISKTLKETTR